MWEAGGGLDVGVTFFCRSDIALDMAVMEVWSFWRSDGSRGAAGAGGSSLPGSNCLMCGAVVKVRMSVSSLVRSLGCLLQYDSVALFRVSSSLMIVARRLSRSDSDMVVF